MPLLPLEPFVFPAHLLTAPAADGSDLQWWVLHTRPRAEKTLARKLLRQSIAFFLPVQKRQWRHRGRLQCSYVPLFPGYVFLHGDRHALLRAVATNLVVKVLTVEQQSQLHTDLGRIYYLIATGAPLTPEDQLQPGTVVEITRGPLTGLQGKILRRGKQLRFIVEVQFLERGVSVEIESGMIQPHHQSPAPQTVRI
jgi:transcriptional antiterminator RfaH